MKKYIVPIFIILAIIVVALLVILTPEKSGRLDQFATCLKEKGAQFYGAFWCPHCQNQKALFGRSAKKLPYIECSAPDTKSQLQICKDKGISTYPTWDFSDGERITGVINLESLSQKTGCELPQE